MPNLLSGEKSPYLLQHANNPVEWRPWGEAAFAEARQQDKPIFLSIGYSTCHWCHVMERESFENEGIAALLNRSFIPIKVDREERPDVDRIYMLFVQAATGSGGWPMSVWLTPDLRPFYGGTYFPPERRYGHPGFAEILERIASAWQHERPSILESSTDILGQLREHAGASGEHSELTVQRLDDAYWSFRRSYDAAQGGFGEAPKFPRVSIHAFLLRHHARTGNQEPLEMVLGTLDHMARGGIHDHVGGGFHRYAVDGHWFVPHFEKMLYDQAQIAVSCLEAYQVRREEWLARVARGTLDYVLRDMTHPEGGFFSAEDADSVIDASEPGRKGEGAFYVWTAQEIEAALGEPAAEWFRYQYGVREGGNVREDPHQEFAGKNILWLEHSEEETAAKFRVAVDRVREVLADARAKLLEVRGRRVRPHLDDKVLAGWNGLMISAFAKGAQVLGDGRYLEAARRAAAFLLHRMHDDSNGTLLRRFREGEAAIPGFLDDYAFVVQGLLDLYEAGFDLDHLFAAARLTEAMIDRFEDREAGGFFATEPGAEHLVLRLKDDYDGAEPSGNSVAILNLLRLAEITGNDNWRATAQRALEAFAGKMVTAAMALPAMLASLDWALSPSRQIVIAGERDAARAMLAEVHGHYVANRVVLLIDNEETRRTLARWRPEVAEMRPQDGKAAAYVCENFECRLPVTDAAELGRVLSGAKMRAGS